jgi:hypothetical protein
LVARSTREATTWSLVFALGFILSTIIVNIAYTMLLRRRSVRSSSFLFVGGAALAVAGHLFIVAASIPAPAERMVVTMGMCALTLALFPYGLGMLLSAREVDPDVRVSILKDARKLVPNFLHLLWYGRLVGVAFSVIAISALSVAVLGLGLPGWVRGGAAIAVFAVATYALRRSADLARSRGRRFGGGTTPFWLGCVVFVCAYSYELLSLTPGKVPFIGHVYIVGILRSRTIISVAT